MVITGSWEFLGGYIRSLTAGYDSCHYGWGRFMRDHAKGRIDREHCMKVAIGIFGGGGFRSLVAYVMELSPLSLFLSKDQISIVCEACKVF